LIRLIDVWSLPSGTAYAYLVVGIVSLGRSRPGLSWMYGLQMPQRREEKWAHLGHFH